MENTNKQALPIVVRRLLGNRLLVKVIEKKANEQKTAGGIILPTTAVAAKQDDQAMQGVIIQMGSLVNKELRALEEDNLEVGMTILFSKFAGSNVERDGEEYKILRATDVFAEDIPKTDTDGANNTVQGEAVK